MCTDFSLQVTRCLKSKLLLNIFTVSSPAEQSNLISIKNWACFPQKVDIFFHDLTSRAHWKCLGSDGYPIPNRKILAAAG